MHIINACFVGKFGLADYTLSLARALSKHAQSEIVTSRDFNYPDVPFSGTVTKLFRRSRNYPVDIFRFVAYVLRKKPDALVFQSVLKIPFLDGLVARVIRAFGVRVFATVHDVMPHHPRPWSGVEYAFFYRGFDGLIAHSEDARKHLLEFGVAAPIAVVPHGVYDIYRLNLVSRDSAREKLGFSPKDFVALFFGRIDPRKGVGFIVDLIETGSVPEGVKFLFAGMDGLANLDPALHARFQVVSQSNCCKSIVREIEFSEVEQIFQASDVVLLPYKEGTTSGVLKLAVAFDKPVIASNVGDIPSNVSPGTGVVFDLNDPVRAILHALLDIQKDRVGYAERCRSSGAEFAWDKVGKDYFEFLSGD